MSSRGGGAVRVELSGKAQVYCVHDREKRQVTDPELVKFIGLAAGVAVDPRKHKIKPCACCENLFAEEDDIPRLCHTCRKPPTHALGGPIAEPIEGAM